MSSVSLQQQFVVLNNVYKMLLLLLTRNIQAQARALEVILGMVLNNIGN